jgi:hypothetical protein
MKHDEMIIDAVSKTQHRGDEYGNYDNMFRRAAIIASTMLQKKVTEQEVSIFMMAVKLSRLAHDPTHEDSWVDLINYTAFAGEYGTASGGADNFRNVSLPKVGGALAKGGKGGSGGNRDSEDIQSTNLNADQQSDLSLK